MHFKKHYVFVVKLIAKKTWQLFLCNTDVKYSIMGHYETGVFHSAVHECWVCRSVSPPPRW